MPSPIASAELITDSSADSSSKWNCASCTYLNWPKSIKCILCQTPRYQIATNQSSSNDFSIDTKSTSTGKYIISEKCSNDSKSIGQTDSVVLLDSSSKWNCSACTYSNFPKSIKCVLCHTLRFLTSPNIGQSTSSGEQCDSKSINEPKDDDQSNCDLNTINNNLNAINSTNNLKDKDIDTSIDRFRQTKFVNSINKPSTSADKCDSNYDLQSLSNNSLKNNSLNNSCNSLSNENIDHHKTDLQANLNKWKCTRCTLLNWPKSMKCVLCQSPKALNTTSAINSSNSSNNATAIECCSDGKSMSISSNDENYSNRRNTPSPIIGATPQRNRMSNNLNALKTINYNNNLNNSASSNRRKNREQYVDLIWLEACVGTVLNTDSEPAENRNFKRNEILEALLENRSPNRCKRVPCQVSLNYGHETRKFVNNSLRQRKGDFPCYFVNDFCTFALSNDILELSPSVQECLFEDLLDKDVQNELEESSIINWSMEITVQLGSRLYALWNRSKGDCLLDSVLQATYGVFDKDNRLRKALADSLNDAAHTLLVRFKEAEILKFSHQLPYALDQMHWTTTLIDDWSIICSIASQPGSALEQFHIFVLCHILRRPIIVYGVKFFKSYRGEKLALAGFEGFYIPLHYDPKFCFKSPISLAYTKGHFCALVPMEGIGNCVMMNCICENGQVNSDCPNCVPNAANIVKNDFNTDCCYLPLVTSERELLPLHFLVKNELGRQEEIMRQYLDCCVTDKGILVCKQKLQIKKPYPMQMMLNEWLDFYRNYTTIVNSTSSNEHESNNSPKCTNDTTNFTTRDDNYISDEDSD